MGQVPADRRDRIPAIVQVGGQDRIDHFPGFYFGNIIVGGNLGRNLVVARQATATDHSPKIFRRDQIPGGPSQRPSEAMVLVCRMNKQICPVQGVTCGVMIQKCSVCGQGVPRIIEVEMSEPNHEGEVSSGNSSRGLMNRDELAFGEKAMVGGEFRVGVGTLGRVYFCANGRDFGVIFLRQRADQKIFWQR